MKVNNIGVLNNITSCSYSNTGKNLTNLKINNTAVYKNYANIPYTNQFLALNPSFTGGYSMNLSETLKNLNHNAYPPDIKDMIERTLKEGNPEDKTLIDIHKEKYGRINQMKSLKEVKAAYPEFEQVLSDKDVNYNSNSFIDDVKRGKLEWFDEDTDLALQLLQMYWADGCSVEDLKKYTGGKDIDSVFTKLRIPKSNRTYVRILQLSDKEYNKKFAAKMSERLTGIQRKKAEKRDGVYIPRGPMSEEQKKKISEGLIKHYAEHPEKLVEMSERMKQYYSEHPEESEKLSKVLDISWGLREAKSVRKALSKFLKKKDVSPEEFTKLSLSEDKAEGKTLKDFWNRMPWAKKQWSACMTKGWEIYKKQKAEEEDKKNIVSVKIYPPSMEQDIKTWLKTKGYDLNKIIDFTKASVRTDGKDIPRVEGFKYTNNAVNAYFDETNAGIAADMYQVCLLKTMSDIIASETLDDVTRYAVGLFLAQELKVEPNKSLFEEMTTEELTEVFSKLYTDCTQTGKEDIIKILDENLEKAYVCVKNRNKGTARRIGINAQKAACILFSEENLRDKMYVPQKVLQSKNYTIVPPKMKKEIIDGIKKCGTGIISDEEMEKRITDEDISAMALSNLQDENARNNLRDSIQLGILKTIYELLDEANTEGCPREKKDAIYAIRNFFYSETFDDNNNRVIDINTKDLSLCYINIVNFVRKINYPDIAQRFESNLDKTYCTIRDMGTGAVIDVMLEETSAK